MPNVILPNLGIELPDVGSDQDTWGDILNNDLTILDTAVQYDVISKTLAGVDVTLTDAEAASAVINLTGTLTANVNLIVPVSPVRLYLVNNGTTGAFTVTVKTPLGTGVTVLQGANSLVYSDGTNIIQGATSVNGSFAVSGALSSGSLSYTGTLTGGTGAVNIGSGQVSKDANGNVAIANATPSAWATFKGLDLNTYGAVAASTSATTVAGNCFFNGTNWIYKQTGPASRTELINGRWVVFTAPSGTAGNPITFTQAMTLTQAGNLLVGTTVDEPSSRLRVSKGSIQHDGSQLNVVPGLNAQYEFVNRSSGGGLDFFVNGGASGVAARITSAGNLRPGADNAYSLGESAFRWSVVFAATGTINTSDERSKLDFGPTLGLSFINALEPTSYRYKVGKTVIDQVEDGTEAVPAVLDEQGNEVTPATTRPKYKSVERQVEGLRRHHGLKAQQVKSVLDQFGVDFAGWVLDDPQNPDSQQGLRYDQFIAPLIQSIKEQQAIIQAQQAQIDSILARLTALEAR